MAIPVDNKSLIQALMQLGQPQAMQSLAGHPESDDAAPPMPVQPAQANIYKALTNKKSSQGLSAKHGDEIDQMFYGQVGKRQGEVDELQGEYEQIKNKPVGFNDINLKPAMTLADQLLGTNNTAAGYSAPTNIKDRQTQMLRMKDDISRRQNSIADDQLAYLKQKSADRRNDQMMAKLGATKSVGWDAADREAGKDYVDWSKDGFATATAQAAKLRDAIAQLKANPDLTGGNLRFTTEGMRERWQQQAYALQKQVESAVQNTLKLNLGGQFTEREGDNVLRRAFNHNLDSGYNINSLVAIADEIEQRAHAKNAEAQHFQKSGTVRNYSPQSINGSGSNTVMVTNGVETIPVLKADLAEALSSGEYKEVR